MTPKKSTGTYDAKSIHILEGLEAVRKRPGMYIGDTSVRGFHHLVYEVVDNSLDEALAGYCTKVDVVLYPDGSISVEDNGRGIPTDIHPQAGVSAAEVVLTKLHAGGKFDKGSYAISGGLHGVGVSVVNALSQHFHIRICRDGKLWEQEYERGVKQYDLRSIGKCDPASSGTMIRFTPDQDLFEIDEFNRDTLARRFRELAFLVPGVSVSIRDERGEEPSEETFCYEGGLKEFVRHINREKNTLFEEPVVISGSRDGVSVDIAIQYNDTFQERVYTFANLINTIEGGTHETGFRSALTRLVNEAGRRLKHLKDKDPNLSGEDLKEGLSAVISVKVPEPQFEGQTKTKLGNSDVRGIVDSLLYYGLLEYMDEIDDSFIAPVINKATKAREAREAARKARDLIRKQSGNGDSRITLPGKLADCQSRNPEECELFIVEGDSAGGSAKQGRNRAFQAILPLRGKILNVEKATLSAIYENREVESIIQALGTGIGDDFRLSSLRYHKVAIMCDADVDGSHIRTLLLTFFFRYMRPLVEKGHLYATQPPLYQLRIPRKDPIYFYDDAELKRFQEGEGKALKGKYAISRYKGLGEMNPEQLWETTMSPENRVLKKITMEDAEVAGNSGMAEEVDRLISLLMGSSVEPRRKFIVENSKLARNIDI